MDSQLSCTCEACCNAAYSIECSSGCHWHGQLLQGTAGTCAPVCTAAAYHNAQMGCCQGAAMCALPMESWQCCNLSLVTHMTVHEELSNKLYLDVNACSFEAEG